ncbi:hypothetical protein AB4516_22120 [Vibrio sp. 10N.222.54.F12]|uniref:hypothetical protein n=1 Tax=Vibrio TaxID=662 RepID=UPI000C82A306|nr:hypothetical protein [Vibrio tasmaniensis]PML13382.1 hypothetical protein BCT83_19090 [Vibrio tasmaniensis]PML42999.1 hypothetical protein BCT76_21525 [Vibrio tasmaniensis]
MEKFTFIDRYFHSQYELLDFRYSEDRDINSLFTYLNNLHSTADKLKELFNCNIKNDPEFKLLRIIRNYFHHVGDVDEIRLFVTVDKNVIVSHSQHLIIPLETFAKSVKSFIDKNTVPKHNKKYQKSLDYVAKEMASIHECFDYCSDLLNNMEACCNKPSLKLDGKVYELGFDMYKSVYNISNTIADHCRNIEQLKTKKIVAELDDSYSVKNNIGKYDILCHPSNVPIMTIEGFIYPKNIELAI